MKEKREWKPFMQCPVCGQYTFESECGYDICNVCFWEDDGLQFEEPNYKGGANRLSLNNYKKWWNKLEKIIPPLMTELNIKQSKSYLENQSRKTHPSMGYAFWKYDQLIVPRENFKQFVNKMSENGIELEANFYYLCDIYNLNENKFKGYVSFNSKNIKSNNDKILEFIFTNDPIATCKKNGYLDLVKILEDSDDVMKKWEEITPYLSVMPNPDRI